MLETNLQLFILDRIANNYLLVLYFNFKNKKSSLFSKSKSHLGVSRTFYL